MSYIVINTVNTSLNDKYDFGVHEAGCQDVERSVRLGCTVDAEYACFATAEEVVKDQQEDLEAGGFTAEQARGFTFRIFPCCARKA